MFGLTLPGEGTGMAKFQAWARSQGADAAFGWTFIYYNGSAAGDQPTHGIYMKPDSPLYGTRYEIHDTLPNGSILMGTLEEEDKISTENAKKQLVEDGGEIKVDPETGKTIWIIP